MPPKHQYLIDGSRFATLPEFAAHFSAEVLGGYRWGGNLDAFNDILRGGFGTPEDGFILVWKNSALSRERLGYGETATVLEHRLATCHAENRTAVAAELAAARRGEGATVFDWLVEILEDHGPSGSQPEDGVELQFG